MKKFNVFSKKKTSLHTYLSCIKTKVAIKFLIKKKKKKKFGPNISLGLRGLMKGFVSFDPNNPKFTQKIEECTGRVINSIQPKAVQNGLKNVCMHVCVCLFVCNKKGSITFDPKNTKFTQKINDSMGG